MVRGPGVTESLVFLYVYIYIVELISCVKVEVAVQGSIVLTVSVDVKQH